MRGLLERWMRRWWRGGAGRAELLLQVLAAPVSMGYRGLLAAQDRRLRRAGPERVDGLVVLSVGNLVVGGTGKTPLAGWLVGELIASGRAPAIVARGYGSDELELHRRWNPSAPVIADADRVRAARRARDAGADVVVLDDGFQHRRLARDVDLVLLAAEDGLGGRLLPRGPWRETLDALSRAHAVVVTRRASHAEEARALERALGRMRPHLVRAVVHLAPAGWVTLDGEPAEAPRDAVLVVCALARPELFAANVVELTGLPAEAVNFPDHHEYTAADARRLARKAGGRTVVVTEKDAVKLEAHRALLGDVRVLGQEVRWELGEEDVRRLVGAACARGHA